MGASNTHTLGRYGGVDVVRPGGTLMERRRNPRRPSFQTQTEITVTFGQDRFTARLLDSSEGGLGIEIRRALKVGDVVRVTGSLATGIQLKPLDFTGEVRWVRPGVNGVYRCGLMQTGAKSARAADNPDELDFYEVLQLSPNADTETVNRVFRLLAQRFHPDNKETGDAEWFKVLVEAHDVLSNPEKRAAYDARHAHRQKARWKIFENAEAAKGVEGERRKRQGILSLLYLRRMTEPRDPGMSLQELELLLGCPKEHLEFALWFLRENAWIVRADNGKVSITAKGVERAEASGSVTEPPAANTARMLPAPVV
mgnify:FL=1